MITVKTQSEKETKQLAAHIAKHLRPGDIVCLYGDLGAGKTTFVKGTAKHFKAEEQDITSPSYVLMNIYEGDTDVYHFDFYRLEKMNQINTLGYEEFFYGDGVSFIEWPERLQDALPAEHLKISIAHDQEHSRVITVSAVGGRYEEILKGL